MENTTKGYNRTYGVLTIVGIIVNLASIAVSLYDIYIDMRKK